MDGLAAYPQKKEVPEDRNPREQLLLWCVFASMQGKTLPFVQPLP